MKVLQNRRFRILRYVALSVFLIILWDEPAGAHVVVKELSKLSGGEAALVYLGLGYRHILPMGFDHILFILSLFLLSPKIKPLLAQATAFTIAHSITLGLAMYQVITPPVKLVEPLIALSIVFVALENIYSPKLKASRIGVVFLFGLVHGLGFASVLSTMGLPESSYLFSLVLFNIGVELGQLTIIIAAYLLLAKWFGKKPYYRKFVVVPLSAVIVLIAGFWTVQRIFF
jgi:hypothetical protein